VRGERCEQGGHARLAQPGTAQLEAAQRAAAAGAAGTPGAAGAPGAPGTPGAAGGPGAAVGGASAALVGGGVQLRGELPRALLAQLVVRGVDREGGQRRVGERGAEARLEAWLGLGLGLGLGSGFGLGFGLGFGFGFGFGLGLGLVRGLGLGVGLPSAGSCVRERPSWASAEEAPTKVARSAAAARGSLLVPR